MKMSRGRNKHVAQNSMMGLKNVLILCSIELPILEPFLFIYFFKINFIIEKRQPLPFAVWNINNKNVGGIIPDKTI